LCFKKIEEILNASSHTFNSFQNQSCQNKILERLSYEPSLKKKKKLCESLKDNKRLYQECMDQYYYEKTIERLDIKSCNYIKDINVKNRCIENAIFSIAVEHTDIKMCDKLKNESKKIECKDKVNLRIISLK
jgi:hypothetical protein